MKKTKAIVNKSVSHFADVLGLSPINAHEIKIRSRLNKKIIEVVKHKQLTSTRVAQLANTYSTSVASILEHNIHDIPTNLMLRILVSLGIRGKIQVKPTA